MAAQAARALAAAGLAALALGAAGCGNKDEGISGGGKVIGRTVTVYSIVQDPSGAALDLVDGEKLALSDAHGRAGALSVNFSSLDAGDGTDEAAAHVSRRAISDPQIIAAIADRDEGDGAAVQRRRHPAGLARRRHGPGAGPEREPVRRADARRAPARRRCPPTSTQRFRAAFGHAPQPSAQEGYRAMAGIIAAVAKATPGNDRTKVISAFGL